MVRIGSALFNANHGCLEDELFRVVEAGIDFIHWDVFDGHLVPDLAFSPRTMQTLRGLTDLPFEVHLAASDPLRFVKPLAVAGADLLFLPAEATPMLYEAIYTVREAGLKAGVSLALGTHLSVLEPVLPMVSSVLLLGRVTGEGARGRDFNRLVVDRVHTVAKWVSDGNLQVDIQAAGGLELDSCKEVVAAGATSLPLGGLLHRQQDLKRFTADLRARLRPPASPLAPDNAKQSAQTVAHEGPFRVLVASRSFGKNVPEVLDELRAAGCEVVTDAFQGAPTEDQLAAQIGSYHALVSGTEPVTERVLAAAPNLRVIAKHGVGFDNIDIAAARTRGIPVALAGNSITDSVADMAFALILALAREVPRADAAVKAGRWDRLVGTELRGTILGICGLGAIGKAVCMRAQGFGMRCIAFDTYQDVRFAKRYGVEYVDFGALLEQSDFLSVHAPLTPETRNLFGAAQFARMKPSAYLVNTSRGELVNEDALFQALQAGQMAGAASDVFCNEPPVMSPLLALPNFISTPHIAGQTRQGLARMGRITAENLLRVLRGESPLYQV